MKMRLLGKLCLVFFVALEVGCGAHHEAEKAQSGTFTPESQMNNPIIYCWYVVDNGEGGNGYTFFPASIGRPLRSDERLYHEIDELRQAIRKLDGGVPVIIPKHPDWVPEHWKVRNLTTNETAQLDDLRQSGK